jgi:hypothetical protein
LGNCANAKNVGQFQPWTDPNNIAMTLITPIGQFTCCPEVTPKVVIGELAIKKINSARKEPPAELL